MCYSAELDIFIMGASAEVVGGLPFIPFAMILSAVIGDEVDPTQGMYLIMVVPGVLKVGPGSDPPFVARRRYL